MAHFSGKFDFLSDLVDLERQPTLAKNLSLAPVRRLLTALGNPHDSLFIIHVAGTKGKGSVAIMLEAILRQAGYRTGLFTSPHVSRYEERFQVNGKPMTTSTLAESFSRIREIIVSGEAGDDPVPSCFDVATAAAFLCFQSSRVDVAIIEVGMGGRVDSTNICMPQISVITNISLDHTEQLGSTLSSIAAAKAGIIKAGRPTISGVTSEEARVVVEATCRERESGLCQLGVDFSYRYTPAQLDNSDSTLPRITVTTRNREWPEIPLNIPGEHQAANASIAVATIEKLQELGFRVSDEHVGEALSRVQCPARIEIVRRKPLVILDCAHTAESAQALLTTLQASFPRHMGLTGDQAVQKMLIFGCSRDKHVDAMMSILAPHFDHIFLTQYARSSRCASQIRLESAVRASQVNASTVFTSDPAEAWKRAEHRAGIDDLICVTGSVFLAGEIREICLPGGSAANALSCLPS